MAKAGPGTRRMDQRIDIFLDEGWCLIDQLHRWSSVEQVESKIAVLNGLIRDLQAVVDSR